MNLQCFMYVAAERPVHCQCRDSGGQSISHTLTDLNVSAEQLALSTVLDSTRVHVHSRFIVSVLRNDFSETLTVLVSTRKFLYTCNSEPLVNQT